MAHPPVAGTKPGSPVAEDVSSETPGPWTAAKVGLVRLVRRSASLTLVNDGRMCYRAPTNVGDERVRALGGRIRSREAPLRTDRKLARDQPTLARVRLTRFPSRPRHPLPAGNLRPNRLPGPTPRRPNRPPPLSARAAPAPGPARLPTPLWERGSTEMSEMWEGARSYLVSRFRILLRSRTRCPHDANPPIPVMPGSSVKA